MKISDIIKTRNKTTTPANRRELLFYNATFCFTKSLNFFWLIKVSIILKTMDFSVMYQICWYLLSIGIVGRFCKN